MYRCLDENEYLWDGDVFVYSNGEEFKLSDGTGFRGEKVKDVLGWKNHVVLVVLRKNERDLS